MYKNLVKDVAFYLAAFTPYASFLPKGTVNAGF